MIPGVTADDFVNPSFQLKTKKQNPNLTGFRFFLTL